LTKFAQNSKTLSGYEEFIAEIRELEKSGMVREDAINHAVDDCISRNILKEFLEKHSSEVRNMLLSEWNMADALRVREEEGIQKGMQRGMQQGMIKLLELLEQGVSLADAKKKLGLK
jgi:hypothetical protein